MSGWGSGSKRVTADSIIGVSGRSARVYSVTWESGGTAGNIVLRNGASASGDVYVNEGGNVNSTKTLNWKDGLFFPDGCFYDHDSNSTYAVIEYITLTES